MRSHNHVSFLALIGLLFWCRCLRAQQLPEVNAFNLQLDLAIIHLSGLSGVRRRSPQFLLRCWGVHLHRKADGDLLLFRENQCIGFLSVLRTPCKRNFAARACPGAQLPAWRQLHQRCSRQPSQSQQIARRCRPPPIVNAFAIACLRFCPCQFEDDDFRIRCAQLGSSTLHRVKQGLMLRVLVGERCSAATFQTEGDLTIAWLRHPQGLHLAAAGPRAQPEHTRGRRSDEEACRGHCRRRRRWWRRPG
mmetsp:Transcript_73950/g.187033  ORF Transcript_73950/g.187033 Transcript_73950/m.187033 type:complete len:248 (-) Transcript_73950:34-777(-)